MIGIGAKASFCLTIPANSGPVHPGMYISMRMMSGLVSTRRGITCLGSVALAVIIPARARTVEL